MWRGPVSLLAELTVLLGQVHVLHGEKGKFTSRHAVLPA